MIKLWDRCSRIRSQQLQCDVSLGRARDVRLGQERTGHSQQFLFVFDNLMVYIHTDNLILIKM